MDVLQSLSGRLQLLEEAIELLEVIVKRPLMLLLCLILCCPTMALVGCKAEHYNPGSSSQVDTSSPDFPVQEAIVGSWSRPGNVEGYVFNADGTGVDTPLGSFTYTLEYREAELDDDYNMVGWVLHISYDTLPAAKIMWVIFSDDTNTFKTYDSSGNTKTYERK